MKKNKMSEDFKEALFVIFAILFIGGFGYFLGSSFSYWKGYEASELYYQKAQCQEDYSNYNLKDVPANCLRLLEVKIKK